MIFITCILLWKKWSWLDRRFSFSMSYNDVVCVMNLVIHLPSIQHSCSMINWDIGRRSMKGYVLWHNVLLVLILVLNLIQSIHWGWCDRLSSLVQQMVSLTHLQNLVLVETLRIHEVVLCILALEWHCLCAIFNRTSSNFLNWLIAYQSPVAQIIWIVMHRSRLIKNCIIVTNVFH